MMRGLAVATLRAGSAASQPDCGLAPPGAEANNPDGHFFFPGFLNPPTHI